VKLSLGKVGSDYLSRKISYVALTRSGTAPRSNRIHCRVSAIHLQMSHDPSDVVLDREFRQLQACPDLFVRHSFGHQCHQLALPARQIIRGAAARLHLSAVQKKSS
jgi:hypothetical protein